MPATAAKTYTTQAICLKTYDYGEADKILHLLSPHLGRVSVMAKGARKANSRLSGACELLNFSEMHLTRGRNFDVLSQYQSLNSFIGIRADILKLACATLFAELVHALSTELDTDSAGLFSLLEESLTRLEACPEKNSIPEASAFQMALLEINGVRPLLGRCLFSDEAISDNTPYYAFSAEQGGIVLPEYRHHYPGVSWVNVSTPTLRALDSCDTALDEALWQTVDLPKTQKFLAYYYQRLLEKPVKAYGFIGQLLEL